jgi:serine/threonine protein kinase
VSDEPADNSQVDLVGQIIDQKYKVLALLGRGGMGAVYLAHHLTLDKDVALKTFATTSLPDETKQRFKREARALGKLQHKNIVEVFDFGIASGGLPYYTMEHLDGESVAERIARKGPLDTNEAIYVFSELCHGLSFCHKNGVVHRDIKPANIFLKLQSSTSDAIVGVKLVDFGIAALADTAVGEIQNLTAAGTVFGSPLYMSPEQSMGLKVDACSDIYSSGCALFEMLTGKPPFRAATAFATMLCHQEVPAPTLVEAGGLESERTYPDWLEELVAELLAKDPAERPRSLTEVLDVIGAHSEQLQSHSLSPKRISEPASQSKGAIDGRFKVFLLILVLPLFALGTFLAVPQFNSLPPQSPLSVQQDKVPVPVVGGYRIPSTRAGVICFKFPEKEIGRIGQGDEKNCIPACGVVEIKDGPAVVFRAGQAICDQPELLVGFGANDLFAVLFEDGLSGVWSDKTVAAIEHISSLQKVIVHAGKFSPAAIVSLNKLPRLIDLGLSDSTLTGEDLLKLDCLPRLESLVVSGMKKVSPAIASLAQRNSLHHFTAQDCQLRDADLISIGKMHELRTLNIEGNAITAKNLSVLLNLPNLNELYLEGNPIEPSGLAVMLKLKSPMIIHMPSTFWNSQTSAAMAKRFGVTNLNSTSYVRLPN